MRIFVIIRSADKHCRYTKGDVGYIDGYVFIDEPFACIVLLEKKRIVLIPVHRLEITRFLKPHL